MHSRKFKDYLIIISKGMAMGAADVVPGVSGGTIAFISGIYEELLASISSVNKTSLILLKNEGIKSFWKAINGNFLAALLLGIFISIVSLAKLISYLLDTNPILVWSFFFGLVLASVVFIGRQIKHWNIITLVIFILGAFIAYFITSLDPMITSSTSLLYFFISGALAICAMILPGISGAFILVLLGAYKPVLDAIHTKNFITLAVVGLGAVVGLLSFSRILNWLFKSHKNITLALLTGFILGSLNKIWPWKEVVTWRVNSHGENVPFREQSVLPINFSEDPKLFLAIVLMIVGFLLIVFLEKIADHQKDN